MAVSEKTKTPEKINKEWRVESASRGACGGYGWIRTTDPRIMSAML